MSTRCVSISELMHLQVRGVSFSPSGLRFSLHLAPKVLLRKAFWIPCSGPILTTLVLFLRVEYQRGWLAWWLTSVSWLAFNLFEVYLRTLSYDDLPSRSTGKLKKSPLGVCSTDCQWSYYVLGDYTLVPRLEALLRSYLQPSG